MKKTASKKSAKWVHEQKIRSFFSDFLEVLFTRRDLESLKPMLAASLTGIGTAIHEISNTRNECLKRFKDDIRQIPDSIKLDHLTCEVQKLSDELGLVMASVALTGVIKAEEQCEFCMPHVRITAVISLADEQPQICHLHLSVPQENPGEPESFPIRRLTNALQESEEKFRKIFDNAPAAIFVFDENGIIKQCNKKFLQLAQNNLETLIGLNLFEQPNQKAMQGIKDALNGKSAYYNGFFPLVSTNSASPVKAVFAPVFDANGQVTSGIGIIEDISEFKNATDKLQYHYSFERLVTNISTGFANSPTSEIDRILEKALQLTCDFFAVERGYIVLFNEDASRFSFTHEWRPAHIKSIKARYQDFPVSNFTFVTEFQTRKVDYHYFKSVEKMPDAHEEFKIVLREDKTTAVLVLPLLHNNKLIGLFGYDCINKIHSWTDEEISLLRVIGEIYANALARKESERQSILIEAHRQQTERADSLAKLAEAVAHQFNNQLQIVIGNLELLKANEEDRQKKKQDDAMKAAMKAAELSAMLMAYLGETHGKSPEDKTRENASHSQTLPIQLEGGYILVVEDDQMVRFITTSMLQHFNFEVIEAQDGVEAMQLFDTNPRIKLVICDLIMPGMDGWQTLAALRKKSARLPFILASGYDDAMALKGSHTDLPQAFLRKPFNSVNLQEAIRLALTSF
ncbi:MAG TPA: response regulator [Candidatus Rifleibacterium sp.]|nr:response regulator [Candidatus Rifleibacterium sp.]HPT45846.1 response regulator [Candidatus Rifleibacterium sp.]